MDDALITLIDQIIIVGCFFSVIILIITNKLNRAIAALIGAVIVYFTLIFTKKGDFLVFIDLILGVGPDYQNYHALILILGMLFIVQVCSSAGVFQFIAFQLIKMTKGKPIQLLFALCAIMLLVSSLFGAILAIIILIPLTFVVSRILSIDPILYIFSQALIVPLGEMIFSISSVPAILITTSAKIGFVEYFQNVGLFCLLLFLIAMIYVYFSYRNKLVAPKPRLIAVLMNYNAWNYVPNRNFFYKSLITLIAVLICFIIIPTTIITPDIIAITGAIVLVVISKLNGKEIIQKLDLELLLFLLGIFIITGAMEHIKIIEAIAKGLEAFVGGNPFLTIVVILWISGIFSGLIEEIPVVKVFIPVVNIITFGQPMIIKPTYYGLAFGVGIGNNLTPFGDTLIVKNITEEHGVQFSLSRFFKLGVVICLINLITVTIYFTLYFFLFIGLLTILVAVLLTFSIILIRRYLNKSSKKFSN